MVKVKIIILIAVLAVVLVVAYFAYSMFFSRAAPAKLMITSQPVEIDRGSGWSTASDNSDLYQGYSVRTGAGGRATIVWFDASVTRLDESTEVSIDQLITEGNRSVSLEQSSGRTWNRVSVASGVTSYTVETPTTVATVRGTGFAIIVGAGESDVNVAEGKIEVASLDEMKRKIASKMIEENQTSRVRIGDTDVSVSALVRDEWITKNLQDDEAHFAAVKQKLKQRYSFLLDIAKSRGMTDEQVEQYLDGYVRGKVTIRQAIENGWISEADASIIPEELRYERPTLTTSQVLTETE